MSKDISKLETLQREYMGKYALLNYKVISSDFMGLVVTNSKTKTIKLSSMPPIDAQYYLFFHEYFVVSQLKEGEELSYSRYELDSVTDADIKTIELLKSIDFDFTSILRLELFSKIKKVLDPDAKDIIRVPFTAPKVKKSLFGMAKK